MNPDPEPAPEYTSEKSPLHTAYRGNGKIARLPWPIRDQISRWIVDGLSYPHIIKRLGDRGAGLNPNLTEWEKRGHKNLLAEQAFIARTHSRQETPHQLLSDFDATHVSHAALPSQTEAEVRRKAELSRRQPSTFNPIDPAAPRINAQKRA